MANEYHHTAQVERPVACAGKGQYFAIVQYGSKGGELFRKTALYSTRDPRQKPESMVLQDIARLVPAKYRPYIMTIAVIKRCLHPKSAHVRKLDRTPQYERVFSWVVEHDHSVRRPVEGVVSMLPLPYTDQELQQLPIIQTLTTTFWRDAAAIVGMRGVERTVPSVVFSQD